MEQGIQLGKLEGLQQGLHQAMVKTISRTMVIRFDVSSEKFIPKLENLALSELESLGETALTVETPAEFEQALEAMLRDSNSNI